MSVVIRPDLSPLQKVYYKIKSVIAPERKPDVIYDISRGVAYAPGTKTAERIEKTPPTERFDPYKVDEGEIRLKGIEREEIEKQIKLGGVSLPGKIQESYHPELRAYVSTRPEHQYGTAIITRTPTPEEIKKIREVSAVSISSLKRLKKEEEKKLEKFKELAKKLEEKEKKIKEIEKEIDLKSKISEEGYFTGTKEELEKYNKAVEEYQKTYEELSKIKGVKEKEGQLFFEPEKVKVGFGGVFSREVEVSRYDFEKSPIASTFSLLGTYAGSFLGGLGELAGKEKGYLVIPEKKKTIYEPQFGTIQVNPLTGEEITGYKQITIPETRIGTKEQLRKIGEKTGEIGVGVGKYFIPIAGKAIFALEAAELGAGMFKTIKKGEKLTPEQKIEAGIVGAVVVGAGISKAVKYLKKPILIGRGNEILISTKGQQIFGKLFKKTPYKLRIERQPISKGQLGESVREIKPPIVVSAGEKQDNI